MSYFFTTKYLYKIISRPDFLHEKSTFIPRVCEINARFTTNAYLLTQLGSGTIYELVQQSQPIKDSNSSIKKISSLDNVLDMFESSFDLEKPIGVLVGKEVIKFLSFFLTFIFRDL